MHTLANDGIVEKAALNKGSRNGDCVLSPMRMFASVVHAFQVALCSACPRKGDLYEIGRKICGEKVMETLKIGGRLCGREPYVYLDSCHPLHIFAKISAEQLRFAIIFLRHLLWYMCF